LSPELEGTLKIQLTPLWDRGIPAKEIAQRLLFGEPGPYEKLKDYHIWYYRKKMGMRARVRRKSGISRYKVRPEEINAPPMEELIPTLSRVYPLDDKIKSIERKNKMAWAYILLHYYTPLRKSEIYERTIKDFKVGTSPYLGNYLVIDLFRKKKIVDQKHPPKKAPFYIDTNAPYVNKILDWMNVRIHETGDDKQLLFPISSWQAWNIMKRAFSDLYPHYWRFKYITDRASNPSVPIEDLLVDTDLHILTLRKYLMTGEIQRQRSFLRRKRDMAQEYKQPQT